MSTLTNAFAQFRDQFGFTSLQPGQTTDNGALFTMEYLICLLEDDKTNIGQKLLEIRRLKDLYASLWILPGLTSRLPQDKYHQDSMDNVGANLVFSGVATDNRGYASRFCRWGEMVDCRDKGTTDDRWMWAAFFVTLVTVAFRPWLLPTWWRNSFWPMLYWNNVEPDTFDFGAWFGRSPGFLGLGDLTAGRFTTPLRWLGLMVGQFSGFWKGRSDLDAWKLAYVNWYFLTRKTMWFHRWIWRAAYWVWTRGLLLSFPNGMKDVYAQYYTNPQHPLRTFTKPYFKV